MLCSVYTTIAGEYDGPGFCTPIGKKHDHMHSKRQTSIGFEHLNDLTLDTFGSYVKVL